MNTATIPGPRTAAALAARRRKTEAALERVHQAITRLRRERAQVSVAAVARRADVSRTFLYDNAEARAAVAAAMVQAGERRSQILEEENAEREATWRERALNAEEALKAAHTEIIAQRTRTGAANSLARYATWRPNGPRKPSSGSPPITPPSNSASASSPPITAPSTNDSRPPAPTCVSRTGASPTSKPASPNRHRSPDPSRPTTPRPVHRPGGRAVPWEPRRVTATAPTPRRGHVVYESSQFRAGSRAPAVGKVDDVHFLRWRTRVG
jgi:hypothetical protein